MTGCYGPVSRIGVVMFAPFAYFESLIFDNEAECHRDVIMKWFICNAILTSPV